jgi:hypothetical protein
LINASVTAQIQGMQISQMGEHLGMQSVQLVLVQKNMPQICQALKLIILEREICN